MYTFGQWIRIPVICPGTESSRRQLLWPATSSRPVLELDELAPCELGSAGLGPPGGLGLDELELDELAFGGLGLGGVPSGSCSIFHSDG